MNRFKKLKIIVAIYFLGVYVSFLQLFNKLWKNKTTSTKKNASFGSNVTKTALITGGTSGIGLAVVTRLSSMGYVVIAASTDVPETCLPDVSYMKVDLSSPASVEDFVSEIKKHHEQIDVLVNCAGVMFVPLSYSQFGVERHFSVNYFGHFMLTLSLMKLLRKSPSSVVINVTSATYCLSDGNFIENSLKPENNEYCPYSSYASSKLALLLFTYKMQRLLSDTNISLIAFDPGTVNTSLYKSSGWFTKLFVYCFGFPLLRKPADAANDVVKLIRDSPQYFKCYRSWKSGYGNTNTMSNNIQLQDKLWDTSLKLTGTNFQ